LLEWAQLIDTDTTLSGDNTYAPVFTVTYSGTARSPTVVLSHEGYDRLRQFEFSQNNQSVTHASFFRYECV